MTPRFFFTLLIAAAAAAASVPPPACPAGSPLGGMRVTVERPGTTGALPLHRANQLLAGDRVTYAPVIRGSEKREGKVSLVLVNAAPPSGAKRIEALKPEDAEKPASWTVPFRASLAAVVYGPNGLSEGKVEKFLAKDEELVAQLADYAERTAQTEQLLQALAAEREDRPSENLNAALQGFAGQYGLTNKIDRNAPREEQTLALLRGLNPALASYDPIAPSGAQRFSQTAGLATTVAGMFLGSPVGLAAGSAALTLNIKSLLFPNTEFRSSYAQPVQETGGVSLCGRRDAAQGRTRLAYLWAVRLPDTSAPPLRLAQTAWVPAGRRVSIPVHPEKWLNRAREWTLRDAGGRATPVPVSYSEERRALDLDLEKAAVGAGTYRLAAKWDWETTEADQAIEVRPLGPLAGARLTPASQNRLYAGAGRQVVELTGEDFQFLEQAAIVRRGDRYATPVPVPHTLPRGRWQGPQDRVEMQIDTGALAAGSYTLLLTQSDGVARPVDVDVLPPPPAVSGPVQIYAGEAEQNAVLRGTRLDSLTAVEAPSLAVELLDASADGRERRIRVRAAEPGLQPGTLDLRLRARGYPEPIPVTGGITVRPPRPRIASVSVTAPDMEIPVRRGELPAGVYVSVMLRTERVRGPSTLRLDCAEGGSPRVVRAGSEAQGVKLQALAADSLFASFDAAAWPAGCVLQAVVEGGDGSESAPAEVGRVLRLPRIESFRLTAEPAGDGAYFGVLTGRDLEVIEKTGWGAADGIDTTGLPAPVAGEGRRQTLRVRLPWPSPAPHSPLWITLRGDAEGRETRVRY